MNPGWVIYGAIAGLVFVTGLVGLFTGLRNGAVRLNGFEGAPPSEMRWALWSLFAGNVAAAILWPLFVPLELRRLRAAIEAGRAPQVDITRFQSPLTIVDRDHTNVILGRLDTWRAEQPEVDGAAEMSSAFMWAAVQEARITLKGMSEPDVRKLIRAHCEWAIKHSDPARLASMKESVTDGEPP